VEDNSWETVLQDWENMGNEIKRIRLALLKFACNPEYQKLLNKKLIGYVLHAEDWIEKFKAEAEDLMYSKRVIPRPFDSSRMKKVFYGDDAIKGWVITPSGEILPPRENADS